MSRLFVRTCDHCGKETLKDAYSIKNRKNLFCSRECHDKWRHEHGPRGRDHHAYTRREIACDQCGKTFERNPHQAERSSNHFCSKGCHDEWLRGHPASGPDNPQYQSVTINCAHCGEAIERQPWQVNGYNLQFCSRQCHGAYRSAHIVGKDAPNWKGGHSEYYGPNFLQQKRNARRRDNYTCQRCGKTEIQLGRRLDVHHIIPFKTFGYTPGQNENHKEANRLANLTSFCRPCHQIREWEGRNL